MMEERTGHEQDVWLPEWDLENVVTAGNLWPEGVIVTIFERNGIGERRYVGTQMYGAPPAQTTDGPEPVARAYTLLCSVEPALIRAVQQSKTPEVRDLNQLLLDETRKWVMAHRYPKAASDGSNWNGLANYATHHSGCPVGPWQSRDPDAICTCGFTQLIDPIA